MPDLKRLERFVEMLSMIDRGETVTANSLAAHFGVTERTIYRDIGLLSIDFLIQFDKKRALTALQKGIPLKRSTCRRMNSGQCL